MYARARLYIEMARLIPYWSLAKLQNWTLHDRSRNLRCLGLRVQAALHDEN